MIWFYVKCIESAVKLVNLVARVTNVKNDFNIEWTYVFCCLVGLE